MIYEVYLPCLPPSKLKKIFPANGFWSHVFYPMLIVAAAIFIAVILTLILVLKEQSKFWGLDVFTNHLLSSENWTSFFKLFLWIWQSVPKWMKPHWWWEHLAQTVRCTEFPHLETTHLTTTTRFDNWVNNLFWGVTFLGRVMCGLKSLLGERPLEQPTKQQLCRRLKTATATNGDQSFVIQCTMYDIVCTSKNLRIKTGTRRRVLDSWPEIGLQALHRLWIR